MIKRSVIGQIKDCKDQSVWIANHFRIKKESMASTQKYESANVNKPGLDWYCTLLRRDKTGLNQFKDEWHEGHCLFSMLFYDPHFFRIS